MTTGHSVSTLNVALLSSMSMVAQMGTFRFASWASSSVFLYDEQLLELYTSSRGRRIPWVLCRRKAPCPMHMDYLAEGKPELPRAALVVLSEESLGLGSKAAIQLSWENVPMVDDLQFYTKGIPNERPLDVMLFE